MAYARVPLDGRLLHLPKVGPLLYNPAIWKPADAVFAVRPFANFTFSSTLHAEDRRRICKRPSTRRANGQSRKNDDYGSHVTMPRLINASERACSRSSFFPGAVVYSH